MSGSLNMQAALARLDAFWAERGCVVTQPMNTEVGAGTMNPATFLRVLGPEPWNVAYVEPSVRPDDSRYGENPNRLQTHTQYQVILKPGPADVQRLYLDSLAALGVDTAKHDVRFVEDNWESPALGAWGLGWEVWLDGLEITQFTYFQQAGGISLDVVPVEITYGMERIMMALQGVRSFADIRYSDTLTYGDLFRQSEFEMSRYYLDLADIETVRAEYDLYRREAEHLIEHRLPVPAHSMLLKWSHAFNVLDARGAISQVERAEAFAQMRALAAAVAALWLETRAAQGFPLGVMEPSVVDTMVPVPIVASRAADFLISVDTEELPPHDVDRIADETLPEVEAFLTSTGVLHGEILLFATPRRFGAIVRDLAPTISVPGQTITGPAADAPPQAVDGFARKHGVTREQLQVVSDGRREVYALEVPATERSAPDALADAFLAAVRAQRFGKTMRWDATGFAFPRPIRNLTALFGREVIECALAGLRSSSTTVMNGTLDNKPERIAIADANDFLVRCAERGSRIVLAHRADAIRDAVMRKAAAAGLAVDPGTFDAVLDEVTNLVEAPTVLAGKIAAEFVSLPPEVLKNVMIKHQRYVPLLVADGTVADTFLFAADGNVDHREVIAGNERVLQARYADATYFFRKDAERPLAEFRSKLVDTAFVSGLGTLLDRSERIERGAALLADACALDADERSVVAEAGALALFDLATSMVVEMTSLAGDMAYHYAREHGCRECVATALRDVHLPKRSGGELAASRAGAVLAIADRLDSIVGLAALGKLPTSSADPYALRRSAYGAIQTARAHGLTLDFAEAVAQMAEILSIPVPLDVQRDVVTFLETRMQVALRDQGVPVEVVRAVAPLGCHPVAVSTACRALMDIVADADARAVLTAVKRVTELLVDTATGRTIAPTDPGMWRSVEERDLVVALAEVPASPTVTSGDLRGQMLALRPTADAVQRFLDAQRVMDPDPGVRADRIALLQQFLAKLSPDVRWDALNPILGVGLDAPRTHP